MKIVFHEKFYESDYANDGASFPGRLESIMSAVCSGPVFEIVNPGLACEEDVLLAHAPAYVKSVESNAKRFNMAMVSAGAAILAADIGITGEPAFACLRPPGHHASYEASWGYCVFCNMGIDDGLIALETFKTKRPDVTFLDFKMPNMNGMECLAEIRKTDNKRNHSSGIDESSGSDRLTQLVFFFDSGPNRSPIPAQINRRFRSFPV